MVHVAYLGEVSLLPLVLSTGIAAVLLASYFLKFDKMTTPTVSGMREARTFAAGKTEFTIAEIAMFDGKGPETEPILTLIDGKVYNLIKGREYYGEGGSYHSFAGRDSTRLLAKNQISDKSDTGAPLTEAEQDQLQKWKDFFDGKYGSIGVLKQ